MAVNRRLIFWLIKAYIKKWRKTIFIGFCFGLVFFFLLRFSLETLLAKVPLIQKEVIGVTGAYTVDTLPPFILKQVSHGLTRLDKNGVPKPDLATSWDISDSGKTYKFHLKKNVTFTDGTPFTSKNVTLSFSDVKVEKPDDYTIVFHLKDSFSPFLVTVSHPLFKDNFVGTGDYKIKDISVNGTFVTSVTLLNAKNIYQIKVYEFYPTQESLRLAFVLGDVSEISNVTDLSFKNTSLANFPNASVTKHVDYDHLVTLFYNTQDNTVSDKLLRDGLSYALPNSFSQGERSTLPIIPSSWAYAMENQRLQDYEHAKLLIESAKENSKTDIPTLTISTFPKYKQVAEEIAKSWAQVGIKVKVDVVTKFPDNFQIFLDNFNVPLDPDQYSLWHSGQPNNITHYKNLRIDKLLEDGRKIDNMAQRKKIYADFQKYLIDDQPASFLFFPYVYDVKRK